MHWVDIVGPMPYTAVQHLFDAASVPGQLVYLKSDHLAHLGDDVIETLVTHAAGMTSVRRQGKVPVTTIKVAGRAPASG